MMMTNRRSLMWSMAAMAMTAVWAAGAGCGGADEVVHPLPVEAGAEASTDAGEAGPAGGARAEGGGAAATQDAAPADAAEGSVASDAADAPADTAETGNAD